MVRQGLLMGLAILLLAPIASAVDSTGTFTAHGPISLPAGSHASLDMLALLDTDTRTLETLVLETPSLRVLEVEHREAYVDPGLGSLGFLGQTGIRERSWLLTDVRLALVEGEHAGFVGAYPRASSTMEMVLEGASTLSPRKTSIISTSDQGVETADPPEGRFYSQRIHEPHLYARAPGVASIWGGGAIKILGPDIRITAA